jgi:hypothetical protein
VLLVVSGCEGGVQGMRQQGNSQGWEAAQPWEVGCPFDAADLEGGTALMLAAVHEQLVGRCL